MTASSRVPVGSAPPMNGWFRRKPADRSGLRKSWPISQCGISWSMWALIVTESQQTVPFPDRTSRAVKLSLQSGPKKRKPTLKQIKGED
jgi:hypothetical protein